MIKRILTEQKMFVLLFSLMVISISVLLLIDSRFFWQLLLDRHHTFTADYFFKYTTWLGDGLLIAIISILLVFYRLRLSVFTMSTYLISGLFAQLLKRFVFSDVYRPGYVFKQMGIDLHQVLDVGLKSHHSFPSGHTTSAFAFFFSLSLMLASKSGWMQLLFFLAAFLVGFSRMYLNLHFINDVMMGAILGFLTSLPIYWYIMHFKARWLDESLISILKK